MRAGLLAGRVESAVNPRPRQSEAVFVCVTTHRCILALKNAQCFLNLSVRLDGSAGTKETIDTNRKRKVGKTNMKQEKTLNK